MRTILCGLLLTTLAGCGIDETVFIPDYTDLYCDTVMECTDPAVLTFDGIESKDDCLGIIGPEIEAEIGYCDYSPKAAKKCVKAMELMGCPGEGQTVEDVLPVDCAAVTQACNPPKSTAPTGTAPTGTTPTGTTPTTSGGDGA